MVCIVGHAKHPVRRSIKALIPKCTEVQTLVTLDDQLQYSSVSLWQLTAVLFSLGPSLSGLPFRTKAPVIAERHRIVLVQLRVQFQCSVSARLCSLLGLFCSILCWSYFLLLFICQATVSSLILVGNSAVINVESPAIEFDL